MLAASHPLSVIPVLLFGFDSSFQQTAEPFQIILFISLGFTGAEEEIIFQRG